MISAFYSKSSHTVAGRWPKTWYYPGGSAADMVMRRETPVVGNGQGVSSFVHINDATIATVAALTAEAGVYNLADDDPSSQNGYQLSRIFWVLRRPRI